MSLDHEFPSQDVRDAFVAVKRTLDSHVTKIRAVEVGLYSKHLRIAGTSDMVCDWDGSPAVVDYKNLGRHKHREEIEDYFVQGAAYAVMLRELTGVRYENIVVLTGYSGESYVERSSDWIPRLLQTRNRYEEYHHENTDVA